MVNKEITLLATRFRELELHAAQGGREVLRVLINVVDDSQQHDLLLLSEELSENLHFLIESLPPYAPPLNNINRVLLCLENAIANGESINSFKRQIEALEEDTVDPKSLHEMIANNLVGAMSSPSIIYTHTLSETVLGVLLHLNRLTKLESVFISESRPNNDGWDTAKRLARDNVPVYLTIDAAMPSSIEKSDLMLSGAEIISSDGTVVGKVGAYPAAMFCQHYKKPLYIVADSNKVCRVLWKKNQFHEIDEEALGIRFSHPLLHVFGNYFDITPKHLISAYATEIGLLSRYEIGTLSTSQKISKWITENLNASISD